MGEGQPPRHMRKPGDRVQVFDARRQIWLDAVIANVSTSAEARIYYEVIGTDAGPFTGIFDSDHTRDRPPQ
jgi:hypothetical protein